MKIFPYSDCSLASIVEIIDREFDADTHDILRFSLDFYGRMQFIAPKIVEVPGYYSDELFPPHRYLSHGRSFDPGFSYDSPEEKRFAKELRIVRELFFESFARDFPIKSMTVGATIAFSDERLLSKYCRFGEEKRKCPGVFVRWGTWRGYLVKLSARFTLVEGDFEEENYFSDIFTLEVCKNEKAFFRANKGEPEGSRVKNEFKKLKPSLRHTSVVQ